MCTVRFHLCFFFFFNDTATTEIYTLSLHDALPICTSVDLGRAYDAGVDARDLSFTYRTPAGTVVEGIVNYIEGTVLLGDVNLAEPGALIGFAGPRVIKQTIGQDLPAGFQRSEFLMETGFLDQVVSRLEMKDRIAEFISWMTGTESKMVKEAEV